MSVYTCDIAVIGAGSGGIAAAVTAARHGLSVLLVEQADLIGGTAVRAGVHCWEMGAGGTGLPFDIYRRMNRLRGAVGIYSCGRHMSWYDPAREPYRFPGGERILDPGKRYVDTLQRHGAPGGQPTPDFVRRVWHGVPFEMEDYRSVLEEMLAETGRCEVVVGTGITDAMVQQGIIRSILLTNGSEVMATAYIDATADVCLCRVSGCVTLIGQDAQEAFGEPSAPERPNDNVNGVTLAYRVTRALASGVESLPTGIGHRCWWAANYPVASFNPYPRGDINVNMLPTMEGTEYLAMRSATAYQECRRRVLAHWHHLQSRYDEFRDFRMAWIAPSMGVRESYRTLCAHMLTEQDIRAGGGGRQYDDVIAIADHALDTHGRSTGRRLCSELEEPYGVPYRCLVPRGYSNLLVACRGAGFTSIAASSCRLSRTMMQLGQAAGTAAALARDLGVALPDVPPKELRRRLYRQYAQVDWPVSAELHAHLRDEGAP